MTLQLSFGKDIASVYVWSGNDCGAANIWILSGAVIYFIMVFIFGCWLLFRVCADKSKSIMKKFDSDIYVCLGPVFA